MNQPRIESFIEALTHAILGMCIGLVSQLVIFPAVGVQARLSQNLAILASFTVISVARTYVSRRFRHLLPSLRCVARATSRKLA